jgi:hypothetical protein
MKGLEVKDLVEIMLQARILQIIEKNGNMLQRKPRVIGNHRAKE